MSTQVEPWRVTTIEGTFETDLETLKQWIVEGCVLPTDTVSKGTHKSIEAGRVPLLRSAFNGESAAGTAPVVITSTASTPGLQTRQTQTSENESPEYHAAATLPSAAESRTVATVVATLSNRGKQLGTACHNHPEASPEYVCGACANCFCAECTNFVSTSAIPVCPLCGELCRLFADEQAKEFHEDFKSSGFGLKDFGRALRYPLQHKIALLFGAALYGFLQIAGFRGRLVAYVVMFGCISHVISQVAWGRLKRSFMPDFSEFSILDDLVVPLFLGVGIVIVSWGPLIALAVALVFSVIGGGKTSPSLSPLPSAVQQSDAPTPEELQILTDPNADPKKVEEVTNRLTHSGAVDQLRKAAEESKSDPLADGRSLLGRLHLSWLAVLALCLSIVWGVFYGPMALAVAGYTQQFTSVVNPLVGLDTIRRMGGTYVKAFGMVIMVQIVSLGASVILGMILAPFDLPFFGNLPANFIDGSVSFYFNLVVACVLGLSLHKCADRLGIVAK